MKLRVIAGRLGGRQFDSPPGHRTHPMSEKIRGALFNALGDVSGLSFLDAYGGSGAVSFEAISRGAGLVTAIDVDNQAVDIINANKKSLKIGNKLKVIRANSSGWSANNQNKLFDVVICDPPYDQVKTEQLKKLAEHVKPEGLLVLSIPPNLQLDLGDQGLSIIKQKDYGDATLVFYRKTG